MNTEAFKSYIKSIEAFKSGRPGESEKLLASSLGISELTPIMKSSLSKLVDVEKPNEAILTLLIEEMKK